MTDELHDRVNRLLDEAEEHLDSIPEPDADESVAENIEQDGLADLAHEANAVLAETDSRELLDALGLSEGDDEPASIPAAIASGNAEQLRELRALVKLSKLPVDAESAVEDVLEESIRDLHEVIGERPAADDAVDEGEADGFEKSNESGGDAIRSALESALSDVRGELEEARESVGSSDEGRAEAGADEDEEEDRDEDEDEDDGLLDIGGSDGGFSGSRGRLSTMPDRNRADMRAVRRYSTMPDRER